MSLDARLRLGSQAGRAGYLLLSIARNCSAQASAGHQKGRQPAFLCADDMVHCAGQKAAGSQHKQNAENLVHFHRHGLLQSLCRFILSQRHTGRQGRIARICCSGLFSVSRRRRTQALMRGDIAFPILRLPAGGVCFAPGSIHLRRASSIHALSCGTI